MSRTWKNLSVSKRFTILNAFAAAVGFVSFFLLARALDLAVFGEWILYMTAFNLAEMIRTGLVRQGMVYYLSGEKSAIAFGGSSLGYSILVSGALSVLTAVVNLLEVDFSSVGIAYFFRYYPLLIWFTLLPNFATWLFQAKKKFILVSELTIGQNTVFLAIAAAAFFTEITVFQLVVFHGMIRMVASILLWGLNSDIRSLFSSVNTRHLGDLWRFGKYNLATILGSNLLKSTDSFLIGIFMGPAAVAVYNIPLRLLEIAELPVRSIAQTLFPELSGYAKRGAFTKHRHRLNGTIKKATLAFLPLSLGLFVFAPELISMFSTEAVPEGTMVLRIFAAYTLLIPFDRLVGVALDSLKALRLNASKVWLMLLINSIGDIVVILVFDKLWLVAAVTVLNMLVGIIVGNAYLKRNYQNCIKQEPLKKITNVKLA